MQSRSTGWLPRSALLQAVIVAAALGVLATLVYGSYIARGGFITDVWVINQWSEFAPDRSLSGLVDYYLANSGEGIQRSLDYIRLAIQSAVLGSDIKVWLVWHLAMSVAMSASLFLLLREVRIGFIHAAAIAALVLIFPAASSIRLWAILGSPAAITLTMIGFVVALRAFDKGGRQFVLHGVSLALFVASALLYESALPLMLASILLYRVRVPWKVALPRWLGDLLVLGVLAAVLQSGASAERGGQGLVGTVNHAAAIGDQALTLFATVVIPLGYVSRWAVVVLAVLIPMAALLTLSRQSAAEQIKYALRSWLWVLVGGVAIVILGYAGFAPAADYYEPLSPGTGNRINAVPSIGFVLVLYALVMLFALLAFRRWAAWRLIVPGAVLLLCFVVATSWLRDLGQAKDAFAEAYAEGERVIDSVQQAVPSPLPGSVIWAFGQPLTVAPGVPVFDQWGSMSSRVRLAYDDPSLGSLVGAPGTSFACDPDSIVARGPLYEGPREQNMFPYGQTYFVNTNTGQGSLIDAPRTCRLVAAELPYTPYVRGELAHPATTPPVSTAVPTQGSGTSALTDPGERLEVPVRPGAALGYVDYVVAEGETISVSGWAVSGDLVKPARRAVGLVGDEGVGQVEIGGERPDVADIFGDPALERSGFVLSVERSELECGAAAAGLKIVGITDGIAAPLPYVGGSDQTLEQAAC